MVSWMSLVFPILLSAILIFLASSIIHMAVGWHNRDYGKMPGEEKVLAAMRAEGLKPGGYAFPRAASMKEMGAPEMVAKYKQGPVGFLTVVPSGPCSMGKPLILWFLYTLLVGLFAGYVARAALGPGAEYLAVFRLTGTAAILAYAVGNIPDSIWKGVRWGSTFLFTVDGVIYGLLTAGTFGWLWPEM